jgi:hypothetical protein
VLKAVGVGCICLGHVKKEHNLASYVSYAKYHGGFQRDFASLMTKSAECIGAILLRLTSSVLAASLERFVFGCYGFISIVTNLKKSTSLG